MNMGKSIIAWIVGFVLLAAVFSVFQSDMDTRGYTKLAFSDFMQSVEGGDINEVTIKGDRITGTYSSGGGFFTDTPDYPDLVNKLMQKGIRINAQSTTNESPTLLGMLLSWFPLILLIGVWLFFMRQMQGGGKGAMSFGKSRARMLNETSERKTFEDVAGIDEAREELEEIVEFLKDPQKFQRLGGRIPKGCLLVGPPGTGKTLLARAIAGEAEVPFFSISGSDFVEMFVGVGASRVRDMFEQGKKSAPCIIFIDEIDAVGRHRGIGMGGGNDEREQTLNQLLVEMDGFEGSDGVIIIAATNRPDVLDPALLRPGRFDRQITISNPDIKGREKILSVHMKKVPLAPDVNVTVIARGTPGFSGADLANLVNEGALLAARLNKKVVTMADFEAAKDKVMMGVERKSMAMSEEEKKLTAYHEGGHAIVAIHSPTSDPIHKATIIPRGRALGMVMRLPENDQNSITREKLKSDLAVAMGGRVAEEIIFGYDKVTSGASSDIQQATRIAKAMVRQWGMSDLLGPLDYGGESQDMYGAPVNHNISQDTQRHVDAEIKKIVDEAYECAHDILNKHKDQLHLLATSLLEYETLSGTEIADLLAGKTIRDANDNDNDEPVVRHSSVPSSSESTSKKPTAKKTAGLSDEEAKTSAKKKAPSAKASSKEETKQTKKKSADKDSDTDKKDK